MTLQVVHFMQSESVVKKNQQVNRVSNAKHVIFIIFILQKSWATCHFFIFFSKDPDFLVSF